MVLAEARDAHSRISLMDGMYSARRPSSAAPQKGNLPGRARLSQSFLECSDGPVRATDRRGARSPALLPAATYCLHFRRRDLLAQTRRIPTLATAFAPPPLGKYGRGERDRGRLHLPCALWFEQEETCYKRDKADRSGLLGRGRTVESRNGQEDGGTRARMSCKEVVKRAGKASESDRVRAFALAEASENASSTVASCK